MAIYIITMSKIYGLNSSTGIRTEIGITRLNNQNLAKK